MTNLSRLWGVGALAVLVLAMAAGQVPARDPRQAPPVVASIAPVHSLAAMVMEGLGAPHLLLPKGASPHGYALKPSDARALTRAELVIWVGPGLEGFLVKPFATLVPRERVLTLFDIPGLTKFHARRGGAWQEHGAGEGGGPHSHPGDGDGDHGGAGSLDPHLWLDPRNAIAMVGAIAGALARLDAPNAARYRANAAGAVGRIKELDAALAVSLAPIRRVPYIVFHDAYQYFEARYGLKAVGSVVVAAGRLPGIKRLKEVRARLRSAGALCVFAEPQFSPAIAATVVEDTGARIGVLDPLGVGLTPGPGLYENLLRRLARSLLGCLTEPAAGRSP